MVPGLGITPIERPYFNEALPSQESRTVELLLEILERDNELVTLTRLYSEAPSLAFDHLASDFELEESVTDAVIDLFPQFPPELVQVSVDRHTLRIRHSTMGCS